MVFVPAFVLCWVSASHVADELLHWVWKTIEVLGEAERRAFLVRYGEIISNEKRHSLINRTSLMFSGSATVVILGLYYMLEASR